MKVSILVEDENFNTTFLFTKDNVYDIEGWLYALNQATIGSGFDYIQRLHAVSKDEKWFGHEW